MLAHANQQVNGVPFQPDAFTQAVAAGWITAGNGPRGAITQLEFDRAIVRMLGIGSSARKLNTLRAADGWRPRLPSGFGAEQAVAPAGGRCNAPAGADDWETWPSSQLERAHPGGAGLPARSPVRLVAVCGDRPGRGALGAPGVPAAEEGRARLRHPVRRTRRTSGAAPRPSRRPCSATTSAGGFDCSGFVWWVMKLQTYTLAGGTTWSGDAPDHRGAPPTTWPRTSRSRKRIPHAEPEARRHPVLEQRAPHGVLTASSTVYHTGIYLGNGWTINSHGSGAGVTLDYMGDGAGWFHDAFAFGWRVLPAGR